LQGGDCAQTVETTEEDCTPTQRVLETIPLAQLLNSDGDDSESLTPTQRVQHHATENHNTTDEDESPPPSQVVIHTKSDEILAPAVRNTDGDEEFTQTQRAIKDNEIMPPPQSNDSFPSVNVPNSQENANEELEDGVGILRRSPSISVCNSRRKERKKQVLITTPRTRTKGK
jgi:hypothetical protein